MYYTHYNYIAFLNSSVLIIFLAFINDYRLVPITFLNLPIISLPEFPKIFTTYY